MRPARIAAIIGIVSICAVAAGCSSDSGKVSVLRSGAEAVVPPEVAAANGPLVGDATATAAELKCLAEQDNAPWSPTMAAFEVHDSERTHRYGCATFLGSSQGPNQVFAYASAQQYVTPYNLVDRGPDAYFVYGGGYGDSPDASGSFVARVAPDTFDQVWRRVLINTKVTGEWNYPGVVNTLADHDVIVIYGYHIARLDPDTGEVLASATLPTGGSKPGDTAYNGYDALPDGTIVAKTVNRQPGCTEQGFSAFLQCPDPASAPASVLVAIDPSTLKVIAQTTLPEMMGGRVTTTVRDGRSLIYLPGATKLYRYTYADGTFQQDTSWGPVSYLKDGQTAASAMAVIGDQVIGMTNGGAPTATPMSVFAVSQDDSSKVANLQPFADAGAKNSFIPSMVSVDPENHRAYVMDAGAGKVGAIDVAAGKLTLAWSQDQTTLSFTTLVGPTDNRVLIGTDIPVKTFKGLQDYTTEQVVWRDAATGAELARTSDLPKMTTGILVTPAYG
ncbi:MAG TPA: hypothetical protein VFN19_10810, partial [Candidatus Nanopelagicales bacterium]|nr:hypothetical protein [Candidatus Nanopelagicales bacterium]